MAPLILPSLVLLLPLGVFVVVLAEDYAERPILASRLGLVCLVCSLLAGALPTEAVAAERNVVLVVSDDHGRDAGCYGNPIIQTPSLDALASDALLLRQAFCTTASCSASRSVILTGLNNHSTGQYGHEHDFHKFSSWTNAASLPTYLGELGYRTARCGKYHVAPESVYRFEEVLPGNGRNGVAMAQNCRDFIAADDPRPFFLYFCFTDPHRSGAVNEDLPHRPNRFGNEGSRTGVEEVVYDPGDVIVPEFLPDTPACREELAEYYQSVSRLDQGVGALVQALKGAGVYDDTLLIYISDHGIAMPGAKTTLYEPGMHSPCIVRDPYVAKRGGESDAMISWVDLTPTILDFAGGMNDRGQLLPQVQSTLRISGSKGPGQKDPRAAAGTFHGRSFLPIVRGEDDGSDWNEVFASHTFHEIQMYYPMRVVHERRYKLIWNIAHPLPFPFASDLWAAPTWQEQYQQGLDAPYGVRTVGQYIQRPEFELYDLQLDPEERNNLAASPEHADTLARLKLKLRQFQQRTDDPWVLKWQYE